MPSQKKVKKKQEILLNYFSNVHSMLKKDKNYNPQVAYILKDRQLILKLDSRLTM